LQRQHQTISYLLFGIDVICFLALLGFLWPAFAVMMHWGHDNYPMALPTIILLLCQSLIMHQILHFCVVATHAMKR
jgi:hypothetical protein